MDDNQVKTPSKKLSKPKVFIDKDGYVTIVFGKDRDRHECGVSIVHDRGKVKQTQNIFGITPTRFVYHAATAYGDSGYSSDLDEWTLDNEERQYSLTRREKYPRTKL